MTASAAASFGPDSTVGLSRRTSPVCVMRSSLPTCRGMYSGCGFAAICPILRGSAGRRRRTKFPKIRTGMAMDAFAQVELKVVLGGTGVVKNLARGVGGRGTDLDFVNIVRFQEVQESPERTWAECGFEGEGVKRELDSVSPRARRSFWCGDIVRFVVDDGDCAIRVFEPEIDGTAHESAFDIDNEF